MSRIFKRLRLYGIIDQLKRTYKYFLTAFDKEIVAARLTVGNLVLLILHMHLAQYVLHMYLVQLVLHMHHAQDVLYMYLVLLVLHMHHAQDVLYMYLVLLVLHMHLTQDVLHMYFVLQIYLQRAV